ncbi:MAG TPA: FliM/FliN family flagellar motor switch protein [Blastocatellia bacterium]|nr:FliM/FliN family flagellar motor switch protein [Blastocatellia bacterium]
MPEDLLRVANESEIASWRYFSDLPVPLSIEIGRAILTARALLELEPSSVIQLSRSTGDGVDVLAGDRRIARGEIVMIEDHTGVRINEVIAEERPTI